jgi:hypothetical protein
MTTNKTPSVNQFWWLSEPECSEQFRTVYTILVSMPHCRIRGYSQNKIYFKFLHLYMEVPVKCLSPKMDGLTGTPKLSVQKCLRTGLVFRMKSGQGPVLDHSEYLPSYRCPHVQHDTPTKNRFIGAMEATGKLQQSAAKYGIKSSTASDIWTKYKKTGTTRNCPCSGHPPKLTDCAQQLVVQNCAKDCQKPFQQIAQEANMGISEHIVHNAAAAAGYH